MGPYAIMHCEAKLHGFSSKLYEESDLRKVMQSWAPVDTKIN